MNRRNFLKASAVAAASTPALVPLVAKSETEIPARTLKRHEIHAGWITYYPPDADDWLGDNGCKTLHGCRCIECVPKEARTAMRLRNLKPGDVFAFDDTEYVIIDNIR